MYKTVSFLYVQKTNGDFSMYRRSVEVFCMKITFRDSGAFNLAINQILLWHYHLHDHRKKFLQHSSAIPFTKDANFAMYDDSKFHRKQNCRIVVLQYKRQDKTGNPKTTRNINKELKIKSENKNVKEKGCQLHSYSMTGSVAIVKN